MDTIEKDVLKNLSERSDLNCSQKVEKIVSYILEKNEKHDSSNTMSTSDIIKEYANLNKELNIGVPENTIVTMTSILAGKSDSLIICPGKKQGYYLSQQQILQEADPKKNTKKHNTEKDLYPILLEWLKTKANRCSHEVANKRGNAKWANPDLIGIKIGNLFGKNYLEVISVEVKQSLDGWEQYIFEAVSHSMYVHRSYFAFLHSQDQKVPDKLKIFAQKFGIGLVSLELANDDFQRFGEKGFSKEELMGDLFQPEEILPASYHTPSPDLLSEFLGSYNLTTEESVFRFGVE